MRRRLLGHQLVDGDRVLLRLADPRPGQPDLLAVVVVADAVGMMQAADRRDLLAVLLQYGEGLRHRVVTARAPDLPLVVVHPVGQVDEDAPPGACRGRGGRRGPRDPHALQKRQGDGRADPAEHVATVDERRGAKDVHGKLLMTKSYASGGG